MDTSRRVTPGRFRRLTEELLEEELGVIERSSAPDVLVDEVDYALRPPNHERRTPSYGAFVLPTESVETWADRTGLSIVTSSTADAVDDEVRRYSDGLVSWTIRSASGVDSLVVFDRPAGSERDLVVLAASTGAMVVQRDPSGSVRLVGSFGVTRWDGLWWHSQPPVEAWFEPTAGLPVDADVFGHVLRFAVHDLGAQGVGALLIVGAGGAAGDALESRLPRPPSLQIDHPTDLGPLRHVLTQIDGAALFDLGGRLLELGVRLVPSVDAERSIDPLGGTRHTSARRYSHDDPEAIVIAVSENGPVTVFSGGEVVGISPADH